MPRGSAIGSCTMWFTFHSSCALRMHEVPLCLWVCVVPALRVLHVMPAG